MQKWPKTPLLNGKIGQQVPLCRPRLSNFEFLPHLVQILNFFPVTLTAHLKRYSSLDYLIYMIKCDQCDYMAKNKSNLKQSSEKVLLAVLVLRHDVYVIKVIMVSGDTLSWQCIVDVKMVSSFCGTLSYHGWCTPAIFQV